MNFFFYEDPPVITNVTDTLDDDNITLSWSQPVTSDRNLTYCVEGPGNLSVCDIRATHYTFAKPACLVACGGCMFRVKAVSAMIGNGPVRNINLSSTAKGELSLLSLFN